MLNPIEMNFDLKNLFLVFILCCSVLTGISQDTIKTDSVKKVKKIILNGYIKDMQSEIFTNVKGDWINGNLIHNRLNFKWLPSNSFTLAIEARNRFFLGNMLKVIPGYGNTFEEDNGIVKLSKNIINDQSYVLNTTIDRAYVDITQNKFQITIGRQRINWGQTFVWNPNDIFNTYSYFDFDYEEKPGSDAARFQYYTNATDKAEFTIKEDINKNVTAAALYKLNKWNYDFQFMGGIYNSNDYVIGAGWAGQVAKGGFRGEMSYFRSKNNFPDSVGIFVSSVCYDYTFQNSLMIQFEGLYNSNKKTNNLFSFNLTDQFPISAKNPFLSGFSYFASLSYPFTPLINGSLSGIFNPENKMYFIIPNITVSLKNNLDLSLIAQSYQMYDPKATIPSINMIFLRLKLSF